MSSWRRLLPPDLLRGIDPEAARGPTHCQDTPFLQGFGHAKLSCSSSWPPLPGRASPPSCSGAPSSARVRPTPPVPERALGPFAGQELVESVVLSLADQQLGRLCARGRRPQQLDLRNRAIDQQLRSMGGELARVGDLVTSMQRERAEQHGQIAAGLAEAIRTTSDLAGTTQALRTALASPKARGQWGERMADDVLRAAGLIEGVSYRKQTAIAGGTIPDVTFLLPQGDRVLHMDVKFPIDNYLRALEADTALEAEAATARSCATSARPDQGDHDPWLHRPRHDRRPGAALHPQRERVLVHPRARSRHDRLRPLPAGGAVLAVHALRRAGRDPPGRRHRAARAGGRRDPAVPRPASGRSGPSTPSRSTSSLGASRAPSGRSTSWPAPGAGPSSARSTRSRTCAAGAACPTSGPAPVTGPRRPAAGARGLRPEHPGEPERRGLPTDRR